AAVRTDAGQLALLEEWMRSYRPQELFDDHGRLIRRLLDFAPRGPRRMGASPHANGGKLTKPLLVPDFTRYALDVPQPATLHAESTRALGALLRDLYAQ